MHLTSTQLSDLIGSYSGIDGLSLATYLVAFGAIGIVALISAIRMVTATTHNRQYKTWIAGLMGGIVLTVAVGSTSMVWLYAAAPSFDDIGQAVEDELMQHYEVTEVQPVLPSDGGQDDWVQQLDEASDELAKVLIVTESGAELEYGIAFMGDQLHLTNLPDASHDVPANVHGIVGEQPTFFIPRDYEEATQGAT